jgi:hypothetical protein
MLELCLMGNRIKAQDCCFRAFSNANRRPLRLNAVGNKIRDEMILLRSEASVHESGRIGKRDPQKMPAAEPFAVSINRTGPGFETLDLTDFDGADRCQLRLETL